MQIATRNDPFRRGPLEILPLVELIERTIQAAHKGEITLSALHPKAMKHSGRAALRWTPSFIPGTLPSAEQSQPYTASALAQFLGHTHRSGVHVRATETIATALDLLELRERGVLSDAMLRSIGSGESALNTLSLRELTKALKTGQKSFQVKKGRTLRTFDVRGKTLFIEEVQDVPRATARHHHHHKATAVVAQKEVNYEF